MPTLRAAALKRFLLFALAICLPVFGVVQLSGKASAQDASPAAPAAPISLYLPAVLDAPVTAPLPENVPEDAPEDVRDTAVAGAIELVGTFELIGPAVPGAGESLQARFTLRNSGSQTRTLHTLTVAVRGPNCADWSCPQQDDFPAHTDIVLPPGATYTYDELHALVAEGAGYFLGARYQDETGTWYEIAGSRVDFTVGPGLQVVEPLALNPTLPTTGKPVTATFTLRNLADHTIFVTDAKVGVFGPYCSDLSCPTTADFWPDFKLLPPGAEWHYEMTRTFTAGPGYLAAPVFRVGNDAWRPLPGAQTYPFAVGARNPAAAPTYRPVWRVLLLVYRNIDADYTDSSGAPRRLTLSLPAMEMADGEQAFRQYVAQAYTLSSNEAFIEPTIVRVTRPITSLTSMGTNLYWPSPIDTRIELDRLAPAGKYDSVMLLWPQTNFATGESIPSGGWGLAIAPSPWSNGATYVTVANAQTGVWQEPRVGEVWLHEWLHGVSAYYAAQGYRMPANDADGASGHGYLWSPVTGWTSYYRDLMTGGVLELGRLLGITYQAWRSGSVAGPRFDVTADYFAQNTLAEYSVMGDTAWQSSPATGGYVQLGQGRQADHRISRSYAPANSFVLTGRVEIPADGAGPYDSVSLALTNGGIDYWGTLLYGASLVERNHIEIMRSDGHRTLVPMNLTPGWYTIRLLADQKNWLLKLKVWRDGANEPSSWQSSEALAEGWRPSAIGFRHFGAGARVDDLVAAPWAAAPAAPDLLFADALESGNLGRWSSAVIDNDDLAVDTTSALAGMYGLRATVDDANALSANDYKPATEKRYRARFYVDPNSIRMAVGDTHEIFRGSSAVRAVVRVELQRTATGYGLRVAALEDNLAWRYFSTQAISDLPTAVEIDWGAASSSSAANGWLSFWVNGSKRGSLTGLDNDQQYVTTARLGPLAGIDPGTRGVLYFDSFESRRATYIGRNAVRAALAPMPIGHDQAQDLARAAENAEVDEAGDLPEDSTFVAPDQPAAAGLLDGSSPPLVLAGGSFTVQLMRDDAAADGPIQLEVRLSDQYEAPDYYAPAVEAIEVRSTAATASYHMELTRSDGTAWPAVTVFQLNADQNGWEPAADTFDPERHTLRIAAAAPTVFVIAQALEEAANTSNTLYLPQISR